MKTFKIVMLCVLFCFITACSNRQTTKWDYSVYRSSKTDLILLKQKDLFVMFGYGGGNNQGGGIVSLRLLGKSIIIRSTVI